MSRQPTILHEDEMDAYMEALDLIEEGARLSENHSSVPEVVDQLLVEVPSDVMRVAARYWFVDQIRTKRRNSTLAAERAAEVPESTSPESSQRPPLGTSEYRQWVRTTKEGRDYHEDREAWLREQEQARVNKMVTLIEGYAADLHVEWTDELLDSTIPMPDGTEETTWREATISQHRERYEMLIKLSVGNAEKAARHLKAIEELEAAGVETLGDLVVREGIEGP